MFWASSTLRLLAASISITSIGIEFVISLQLAHSPQGCTVGPFIQFNDFAKILAVEVFPVPRGPVNRYACEIFPSSIIAAACGVTKQEFFQTDDTERRAVNAADYLK